MKFSKFVKKDKKALQSKANCPLVERCMGYIANKFEQIQGTGTGTEEWGDAQVNKFEQVTGSGVLARGSPCG